MPVTCPHIMSMTGLPCGYTWEPRKPNPKRCPKCQCFMPGQKRPVAKREEEARTGKGSGVGPPKIEGEDEEMVDMDSIELPTGRDYEVMALAALEAAEDPAERSRWSYHVGRAQVYVSLAMAAHFSEVSDMDTDEDDLTRGDEEEDDEDHDRR